MRIAGIVPNTAAEVRFWQHMDVVNECEARREAWERRFSLPEGKCPYGCDRSGWRAVEDGRATLLPGEVVHGGVLYTFCQCNGRLVLNDGQFEPAPVRPFAK